MSRRIDIDQLVQAAALERERRRERSDPHPHLSLGRWRRFGRHVVQLVVVLGGVLLLVVLEQWAWMLPLFGVVVLACLIRFHLANQRALRRVLAAMDERGFWRVCPDCGYNLAHLPDPGPGARPGAGPTCPECGALAWNLRDSAQVNAARVRARRPPGRQAERTPLPPDGG